MRYRARGSHPIDLAHGRILAPGETADIDPDHPHHQALIDAGRLHAVPAPKATRRMRKHAAPVDAPPEPAEPADDTKED